MTNMSVRALASLLGVSPTTVMSDLKTIEGYEPDGDGVIAVGKVMGLDGKVRPSRRVDTSERDATIRRLREAGSTVRAIGEAVGCSVGTVHRVLSLGATGVD